jgi:hypothetical protein
MQGVKLQRTCTLMAITATSAGQQPQDQQHDETGEPDLAMSDVDVLRNESATASALSTASLRARLELFRRTHRYREVVVQGTRWRYIVSGQGQRTVLLPAGGTRAPDMYLLLFEALEPDFRIVAPAYPPLPTMAALVDGLIGIVNAEGLAQVDVLGSSFGGFVAQCFVRRHPSRVGRLILANTGAPGPLHCPRWDC